LVTRDIVRLKELINGWILTTTIFWLDIWISGTFLSSYAHYKCHFIFQKYTLILFTLLSKKGQIEIIKTIFVLPFNDCVQYYIYINSFWDWAKIYPYHTHSFVLYNFMLCEKANTYIWCTCKTIHVQLTLICLQLVSN
jgi:hypothetical protein